MDEYIEREEAKVWIANVLSLIPAEDVVSVVRCKDCIHKPEIDGEYENGFDIIFPDYKCPLQCEDGWYNMMPPTDNWFCANGERHG